MVTCCRLGSHHGERGAQVAPDQGHDEGESGDGTLGILGGELVDEAYQRVVAESSNASELGFPRYPQVTVTTQDGFTRLRSWLRVPQSPRTTVFVLEGKGRRARRDGSPAGRQRGGAGPRAAGPRGGAGGAGGVEGRP